MKKQLSRYEQLITVQENKPYNPFKLRYIVLFFCGILLAFALLFYLTSCSPYKRIATKPPLTTKDTARLLKRSLATFPVKPPVIKEGKTIVVKGKDSTDFYKKKYQKAINQKQDTKTEIETIYKDTCTSANYVYEEGYNLGYDVGLYDGKKECKGADTIYRVDTITVIPLEYNVQLQDAQLQKRNAIDDLNKLQSKCDRKTAWLWYLVVLCLCLLIGNILQFKFKK